MKLLNTVIVCIPIIISLIAIFTSAFSLKQSRVRLITESVSHNRMDWIKDVRGLLDDFITEYIDAHNKTKLLQLRARISLYLRNDQIYDAALINELEHCIQNTYDEKDLKKLIAFSQNCLIRTWTMMKMETKLENDPRIANKVCSAAHSLVKEYMSDTDTNES